MEDFSGYADDTYIHRWNECLETLIIDMEKSLEMITRWLGESGFLVNKSKTEICLFYKQEFGSSKSLYPQHPFGNKKVNERAWCGIRFQTVFVRPYYYCSQSCESLTEWD